MQAISKTQLGAPAPEPSCLAAAPSGTEPTACDRKLSPTRTHVQQKEEGPGVPEGGWGYVVIFCSFMIHVIVDGVTYTFGIFYVEFLRYFGESKGATSWVASIMVGTMLCVGPFASGLTSKFGCRTVTITGSLLASFGLAVSVFAPSVSFLYFSIGLCTGTGFGLMYLPAIVCVTCYFEKRRAFATGIAVCGSGIGTFLLAPVIEWLVSQYGWRGAMLVTAGFVLNCCVFGALFRPLEAKPRSSSPRRMTSSFFPNLPTDENLGKGSLPNGSNSKLKLEKMKKHSFSLLEISNHNHNHLSSIPEISQTTSAPLARKEDPYDMSEEVSLNLYLEDRQKDPHQEAAGILNCLCPPAMREIFLETMNFRLMRDVVFLMFGFSNFFTNIGLDVPYVYTKDRAVGLGLADEASASYLLCIIGISNTVGRLILGYLSDRSCINRLWLYNASLTVCGLAMTLSSFCSSYKLMALYATVFGVTAGAYVSLTSVVLVDLLGLDRFTNAFGLLLLFEGVACLIGPPITGWLYDWTGSFDPGFYVSGIMMAISGIMLFFIPCIKNLVAKDSQSHQVSTGI